MVSLHTVYVVTLVSQATSTMVLALLAWSDRRSRGLASLAAACGVHTAAIILLPLWVGGTRWMPEALSAAFLLVIFYLVHQGMRLFAGRPAQQKRLEVASLTAGVLLVVSLAPFSMLWSMQLARAGAIMLMALTIRMLWHPSSKAVRLPARTTAGSLLLILVTFLCRILLEPHIRVSALLLLLREITMIEVTLLAFSFLAVYVAETQRRLHEETRLDALTGLPNRRAIEERAARQVRLSQRTHRPLTLLMMDLDTFKLLNDTWGHSVGDRALCAVGGLLLAAAAENEASTVGRIGGEEFAMLLPEHSIDSAQKVAEKLRMAVAGTHLLEGKRLVSFTMSLGLATLGAGETSWTEMLRRADAALYRAKREGRNRVVACGELPLSHPSPRKKDGSRRARKVVEELKVETEGAETQGVKPVASREQLC